MAIVKENFEFWLPMQEDGGNRYDVAKNNANVYAQGDFFSGYNAPPRGVGHVQSYAADFERSNIHGLYIADTLWQHGDEDVVIGGWVYVESDNWIFMCQGGYGNTSCWCLTLTDLNYLSFGVGVNGSTGWNGTYHAVDNTMAAGAWYCFFGLWDKSAHTGYVYAYDTNGNSVLSDSTTSMDFGTNNAGAITFGHTNASSYPLRPPVYSNRGYADGRLEQVFMYHGWLNTADRAEIINGGAGVTWFDLFGNSAFKMKGGRMFWKNWEKIFRPEKKQSLTLPETAVVPAF